MAKPKTAKLGGLRRIGVPITTRERIACRDDGKLPSPTVFRRPLRDEYCLEELGADHGGIL
jgi:hypothetical protein